MKKQVIFVGWISKGAIPVVGETVKNQYIIEELKKYCDVIELDFYQKNKHPWIYLQTIWSFLRYPQASIILSTSAKNVYTMLRVMKGLGVRRNIIHWVVGGAFSNLIENKKFDVEVFNYVTYNLVQCHGMVTQLIDAGMTNAKHVVNFKKINYFPSLEKCLDRRKNVDVIKFVFAGRIHPDKGCEYIFDAVEKLNKQGFANKYIVDFYGPFGRLEEAYRKTFFSKIDKYDNVNYKGVLNFRENHGYDILSSYHALLFPTHWQSEGIAGIFIDSFIAALPVITSDWGFNTECITDGVQGVVFPYQDIDQFVNIMKGFIEGRYDLAKMAICAREEASKYAAENALTKDYLKSIGLVD